MEKFEYKDALGYDIVIGRCYGFTNEHNGLFENRRVIITEMYTLPTPYTHVPEKPMVKGIATDDGTYCYGSKVGDGTLALGRDPHKCSLQNFSKLWPIADDLAKTDKCCIKLKQLYESGLHPTNQGTIGKRKSSAAGKEKDVSEPATSTARTESVGN